MSLQIILFTIYSAFIQTNKEQVTPIISEIIEVTSASLAIYFLLIELVSTIGSFYYQKKSTLLSSISEIAINFVSPIAILICQSISYFSSDEYIDEIKKAYWELVSWSVFFLWIRFFMMLRSVEYFSPVICMILNSFKTMIPYLLIVLMGVFCFTNVFVCLRILVYMKTANLEGDDVVRPPFDRTMDAHTASEWKDKWLGEYIKIFYEILVGAISGLDLDSTKGFTDSQMIMYIVAVLFNSIVLMNLLLAVVGTVQGTVSGSPMHYYYEKLVDQICMLQRLFFCRSRKLSFNRYLFFARERRETT